MEPQALVEVCGGAFSPYLDPERRKELARVAADALVLIFPGGDRPFELLLPWSGAKQEVTTTKMNHDENSKAMSPIIKVSTATISRDEVKVSHRSSAERVVQRSGKLFRCALRITGHELVVSVYSHVVSSVTGDTQLIFNFYSPKVSEAAECALTETDQTARIGRPVLKFPEGAIRAAVIRRFIGNAN